MNPNQYPPDPASEMRKAAAFSIGLAIGAAGLCALAAYFAKPDASLKVPVGPSIADVQTWLRDAAVKMEKGAKAIIEEIDAKAGR